MSEGLSLFAHPEFSEAIAMQATMAYFRFCQA